MPKAPPPNQTYEAILASLLPQDLHEAEVGLGADLRTWPMPDGELAENVGLFQTVRAVKRFLYLNELYRRILPVHGIVMQFGVRWGRDIVALDTFRTIYEPFNIARPIVGFDTFDGFPSVDRKDGTDKMMVEHGLGTVEGYAGRLAGLLAQRRSLDPLPHLERCSIVVGDVIETVPRYLAAHPGTIIALAHFDLDLYAPTKVCLDAIRPYLTKGSIVAFDELNSTLTPGETEALRETWGLSTHRIERSPLHSGQSSFIVIE